MIAVDTNLLIYAHREDSEWHGEALGLLKSLSSGRRRWAIPWPCVHEFIAIATHPVIYDPPTPLAVALDAIEAWLTSASCQTIGEGPEYFPALKEVARRARTQGPRIHDARIAAICIENGASELWSADRDFTRFQQLKVVNPLVERTSL